MIHCAFPFAERTFILKLLMPVINGLPSWCLNSKMVEHLIFISQYTVIKQLRLVVCDCILWNICLIEHSLHGCCRTGLCRVCHPFSISLSGWQKHEKLNTDFFIWYCHVTAGLLITLSSTCVSDNLLCKSLSMIQLTLCYSRCWKWPPTTLRHTWYLVNRLTAVF